MTWSYLPFGKAVIYCLWTSSNNCIALIRPFFQCTTKYGGDKPFKWGNNTILWLLVAQRTATIESGTRQKFCCSVIRAWKIWNSFHGWYARRLSSVRGIEVCDYIDLIFSISARWCNAYVFTKTNRMMMHRGKYMGTNEKPYIYISR